MSAFNFFLCRHRIFFSLGHDELGSVGSLMLGFMSRLMTGVLLICCQLRCENEETFYSSSILFLAILLSDSLSTLLTLMFMTTNLHYSAVVPKT